MAGLTTAGLQVKTLEEVHADLLARAQAEFGPSIKTGDDEPLGHILWIFSYGLAEAWGVLRGVYDGFDPGAAGGVQLDNISALVGVTREPGTRATGTVTLGGDEGTVIPAGKLVRNPSTGDTFETLATVTIPVALTVDVAVQAEDVGAVSAGVGVVTEIATPVSGWSTVTNATAFTSGTDAESDAAFRARRQRSLQLISAATDGSIRSKLEALDAVVAALVISNRTLSVDAFGIPAKGFRAVVWPDNLSAADQQLVAQTIWENQPAGIESDGNEAFTVTDDQGYEQTVEFSFAAGIEVFVEVDVTTGPEFPADGTTQIEQAVDAYLATLSIGEDVLVGRINCAAFSIPGVVSAVVRVDTVDPPVATVNLSIDIDEIAENAGVAVAEV